MTAVFWCAMTMVTVVLIVLTVSYLTHNPNTCRTCVDRAARARHRHPSFVPAEDHPDWGHR